MTRTFEALTHIARECGLPEIDEDGNEVKAVEFPDDLPSSLPSYNPDYRRAKVIDSVLLIAEDSTHPNRPTKMRRARFYLGRA